MATISRLKVLALIIAFFAPFPFMLVQAQTNITPADARAIAKEALYSGFSGSTNTPADTAKQGPNSDTPYSFAGLDLRAEPIVLTVPVIDKSRYFSVQLIDGYSFNFAYLGGRATGNDGGSFLIAGPNWKGDTPKV